MAAIDFETHNETRFRHRRETIRYGRSIRQFVTTIDTGLPCTGGCEGMRGNESTTPAAADGGNEESPDPEPEPPRLNRFERRQDERDKRLRKKLYQKRKPTKLVLDLLRRAESGVTP
jgi:hypothetical protein